MCFTHLNGEVVYTTMECRFSQDSILGPLLWKITFVEVLGVAIDGYVALCCADDTVVLYGEPH